MLYEKYISNNRMVSGDELSSLLNEPSARNYNIRDNELIDLSGKAVLKYPTLKERENGFLMLKDYFENCFKDRERYYENNKEEVVYSNIIPNLIENCDVIIEKTSYGGFKSEIKNKETGENVYIHKELTNLILTKEEQEEFFEMLKWYVINVPYNDWTRIHFDCSFMEDVAIKYYLNAKKEGKDCNHLEKYIIIFEHARVTDSEYFRINKLSYDSWKGRVAIDHFEYQKYKDNEFLLYNKNGMSATYSTPRFYFKDVYFNNDDLFVNNDGRYFDLLQKNILTLIQIHYFLYYLVLILDIMMF